MVIVYLLILQLLPRLFFDFSNVEYASFTTVAESFKTAYFGILLSVAFIVLVISVLGWWRRVLHEDLRAPRWTVWIPILMVLSIVISTNYGNLLDNSLSMILFGALISMTVGVGEELTFRGVVLVSLRDAVDTEKKAALLTAAVFGLAHATNFFTSGLTAFPQILLAAVSGYYFYILRRWSGGLLVPIIFHGLWDYGLFSTGLGGNDKTYLPSLVGIVVIAVLLILVLVKHRSLYEEERRPG